MCEWRRGPPIEFDLVDRLGEGCEVGAGEREGAPLTYAGGAGSAAPRDVTENYLMGGTPPHQEKG